MMIKKSSFNINNFRNTILMGLHKNDNKKKKHMFLKNFFMKDRFYMNFFCKLYQWGYTTTIGKKTCNFFKKSLWKIVSTKRNSIYYLNGVNRKDPKKPKLFKKTYFERAFLHKTNLIAISIRALIIGKFWLRFLKII